MNKTSSSWLNWAALICGVAWAVAASLAPTERTLGTTVRWVYAHASLTQVSLLFFLVAAILSVLYLAGWSRLARWVQVSGWVAVALWIAGFVLSMIPAKLSWGVWVDFGEPRTQMTLRFIVIGALFLLVTLWVAHLRFTAIFQILISVLLLYFIRNTTVVRHPVNPIGQADSTTIPLAYSVIFLFALLASTFLTIRLASTADSTDRMNSGSQAQGSEGGPAPTSSEIPPDHA